MDTEVLIEFIRANWLVLLFITVTFSYTLYMYIKMRFLRTSLVKKKQTLEQELDELNVKLEQQTKQLEEELNRKDDIVNKGKG